MNAIEKTFWQTKEGGDLFLEFALFAIQIIVVIFLLNLSVGRHSGDTEIKMPDLTTSPSQQESIDSEKNTLGKGTQESQAVILSSL